MPRRSGEAAKEGSLRSPLRVELRLASQRASAGCSVGDLSAAAPSMGMWKVDRGIRGKVVWGA
jgi:hypothetical protein